MSRARTNLLCGWAVVLAALAAPACRTATADDHVRRAEAFLAENKVPEAVIELRVAVQIAPNNGDFRTGLADAFAKAGDTANAARQYVRAADLLPASLPAQLKAGQVLLERGEFAEAQARASAVLRLDPKSIEGLLVLGNAMAGLKDLDGAIARYQEAAVLDPSKGDALANLGVAELARGNTAAAEKALRRAVEVAPDSVRAQLALSRFLWASKRPLEAEAALKAVLQAEPDNRIANSVLGAFYMSSGRAREAEPYFRAMADGATTPSERFALVDYHMAVSEYDRASDVLKSVAPGPDTEVGAATRLAVIEEAKGGRAQALSRLNEISARYPREPQPQLLAARLLLRDGKAEAARQAAEAVLRIDVNGPAASGAYLVIGEAEVALDRHAHAIAAYQELLKRERQPGAAELALARLHLAAGEPDKAAAFLDQVLRVAPANPAARALRARVYIAQAQPEKAAVQIAALTRKYPEAPTVLNLTAAQQLAARDRSGARASYTKAVTLAPADLEAVAGLVQLDLTEGKSSEAVARIDGVLARVPLSSAWLVLAAKTHFLARHPARAEALLKQAIESFPSGLEAYSLLGSFYAAERRLQDAVEQFQRLAARDPRSVSAPTMLGMLFEAQQNLPEAEKHYENALAIDPQAPVAANNLAMLYLGAGRNPDQALQLAQAAYRRVPNEPHINDTMGWLYVQRNLASTGVPFLEASVKVDASNPVTHYHLGVAYARMLNYDKARSALQRALALKTDFPGADDARKTLATLGR